MTQDERAVCALHISFEASVIAESCSIFSLSVSWVSSHLWLWNQSSGRQAWRPSVRLARVLQEGWGNLLGAPPALWHVQAWLLHRKKHLCCHWKYRMLTQGLFVYAGALPTLKWHKMPFNGEKQCVGEDQPSDSDSSRFSESMASLSDYECSRQSFTSDSSSKSSSPACKPSGKQGLGDGGGSRCVLAFKTHKWVTAKDRLPPPF